MDHRPLINRPRAPRFWLRRFSERFWSSLSFPCGIPKLAAVLGAQWTQSRFGPREFLLGPNGINPRRLEDSKMMYKVMKMKLEKKC